MSWWTNRFAQGERKKPPSHIVIPWNWRKAISQVAKNELVDVFRQKQDWDWTINFKKIKSKADLLEIDRNDPNKISWQIPWKYYDCSIFVPWTWKSSKLKLWWYSSKIIEDQPDVYYVENAQSIRNYNSENRNRKDASYYVMINKLKNLLWGANNKDIDQNIQNRQTKSQIVDYFILAKLIFSAHLAGTSRVVFSNFKKCQLLMWNVDIIKSFARKWWISKAFIQSENKHSLELVLNTDIIKEFLSKKRDPMLMENPEFIDLNYSLSNWIH